MKKIVNDGWRVIFPTGTVGSIYYRTRKMATRCLRVYGIIGGYVGRATVTYYDGRRLPRRKRRGGGK